MLRTNTTLWRIAFLSGMGMVPSGCGGHANDSAAPAKPGTPGGTDPSSTPTVTTPALPTDPAPPDVAVDPSIDPPLPGPSACIGSAAVLEQDIDTGLESCEDGRIHRPAVVQCVSKLPRGGPTGTADAGASDAGTRATSDAGTLDPNVSLGSANCTSDSECTAKPLGHCDLFGADNYYLGYRCQYGCLKDADCAPDALCECGDPVGVCVPARCHSDNDCGEGLLCARGTGTRTLGCGVSYDFSCETPDDRCRRDEDCASPSARYGSYCQSADTGRVCTEYGGAICGRPFLVQGSARLANVERSSAWLDASCERPDCSALSTSDRRELARAWSRLGLMEHASVAAFARFTLQLLSVGAPAALLEQSQQALADELLHARLCFGLASAYADEALGPGPLGTERALDLTALEDIAALTLHEGCVGETIAALEASEARALARDPAVCAVLARIEADERRHAELAWRFVTWAQQAGGPSVQRRIQRELAGLMPAPASASLPGDAPEFDGTAHGLLSLRQRAELRVAALRDVVLPCARALLSVEQDSAPRASAAVRV